MIPLKNDEQIDAMGRAGAIIAALFRVVGPEAVPGRTTADLDRFVDTFIRDHEGARPAFKGLYGFPASACISVNEEVVHGIPRPQKTLAAGDIVSVDVGVELEGWYADAAITVPVDAIDDETRRLLDVTREALRRGIAQARAGQHLGDIGAAIQTWAEKAGFSVVRDLVGHGIGRAPHEEPQVPNFGIAGRGLKLQTGMVLAIEPMVNQGGIAVRTLDDRWTVVTTDGQRSAHFEHTIAITAGGPRILTAEPAAAHAGVGGA